MTPNENPQVPPALPGGPELPAPPALPETPEEIEAGVAANLGRLDAELAKLDPAPTPTDRPVQLTARLRAGLVDALTETVDGFVTRVRAEVGETVDALPQWQQDVKAAGAKLLSGDAGQREVGEFALTNLALQAEAHALATRLGVKAAAIDAARDTLQAVQSVLGTIATIASLAF